ncbi:MAG TPA: ParA family protein [Labilithrix sp.]|nr:ParA family protein [Labilithrix sp.]
MSETCTVCGRGFEVQFRYQMEERDNAFSFFCSQSCHGKSLRGETTSGVVCSCCNKRFVVDLVSQVVRIKGEARYACSESCRSQLVAEAGGLRLGSAMAPPPLPPVAPRPAPHPLPPVTQRSAVVTSGPVVVPAPTPLAPAATPEPVPTFAPTPAPMPVVESQSRVTAMRTMSGPRRMAIFNHKGGTGKTTTSVSVAAGLALKGYRVLLVDTDSQGNVGVSLGVKTEKTLYHCLVMGLKPQDVAVKVRENLDVLPSNETLAAAELYLAGRQNRDRILRDRLVAASDHYDVILLDCSPSLSLLNQNALVFADGILVPVACDFLSLVGVRQVIKTVKNVNSLLHHPVQIHGVLPTFYDARARICRDAWGTLKEHFGPRCFAPIRSTTRIKEAPAQGKTIFEFAPDSHAATDYQRVVDRLVTGRCADVDVDADADEAMTG